MVYLPKNIRGGPLVFFRGEGHVGQFSECSYEKIFIPVTEISDFATEIYGNRAIPASHMNTSIFLKRKEW